MVSTLERARHMYKGDTHPPDQWGIMLFISIMGYSWLNVLVALSLS